MTIQAMHQARKELLLVQHKLIRIYEEASRLYPAMPAISSRITLHQVHDSLLPLASCMGQPFSKEFLRRWDHATADASFPPTKRITGNTLTLRKEDRPNSNPGTRKTSPSYGAKE